MKTSFKKWVFLRAKIFLKYLMGFKHKNVSFVIKYFSRSGNLDGGGESLKLNCEELLNVNLRIKLS